VLNYSPGTFLSGWDTLHPEFNFPLAFERMLNGVWRTDQGLGAVAIHSHMADLPRVLILWLLSPFIPLSDLRYVAILLPLIIGPLGIYFLTKTILSSSNSAIKQFSNSSYSFLAGIAYLCNMGTVGHFIVPFEMFTIQYAFLPWVLLFALRFLQIGSKKTFLLFVLFSILIIPQAYAATLFYTFFITFCFFLTVFFFLFKSNQTFKRILFIILSTLILNSYWLLPNLYAAEIQGYEVRVSQINRFFSAEAFATNQLYGNVLDASLLKNFLFEWRIYNFNIDESQVVASAWKQHIENPWISGFGYFVFLIAILGILNSIRSKNKKALALLPFAIIGFLALLNGTFPINALFEYLGSLSPTLKEALRFPFTKFSIFWMLGLSVYFGLGISFIIGLLKKKIIQYFAVFFLACSFLFYFAPAFRGQLINPAVKTSIPKEYFELFEWTEKKDKNSRIAILPAHSFWNWVYYSWGYQGSGFLQFGIKQPLLDPDYNRWSKYNEQYQRELHYAVYNQDPNILENVLKKHNVRYIILDKSIQNIAGFRNETLTWYLPTLLEQSGKIKLAKQFGENILVYEFVDSRGDQLSIYKNLPDIGPSKIGNYRDRAFEGTGAYITDKSTEIDNEKKIVTYDGRYIGPFNTFIEYTVNPYSELTNLTDCSNKKAAYKRNIENGVINYTSINGSLCDHFSFPQLSHEKSYVVQIESRNITGFPLQVYICNDLTLHCNQTFHLTPVSYFIKEAFIIPSYDDHGEGHTLNINNYAIRNQTSINEVKEISIREYKPCKSDFNNRGALVSNADLAYSKPGRMIYKISKQLPHDSILVYLERHHPGWKAYVFEKEPNFIGRIFPFLFGTELKDHVTVNNWANGWKIPKSSTIQQSSNSTIILLFLPQYLEYIGFLLLGGLVTVLGAIGLKSLFKKPE
jgi:hypothetical protein